MSMCSKVIGGMWTRESQRIKNCQYKTLWLKTLRIKIKDHGNMKGVWISSVGCFKWSNMQKESRETEYYNTSYSWLKFESNLISNISKINLIWWINEVDRKYMTWVILCKKNQLNKTNGIKDTASGSLNLNLNKFKSKNVQMCQNLTLW